MTEQPMQGGYRRPENPAPVSGPGALSQRTDGQPARYMAGGEYGEGQEMMDIQGSAQMSRTETMPSRGGGRGGSMPMMDDSEGLTPLFEPTQRPDEPITAGAAFGPGPGPMYTYRTPLASKLERLVDVDDSGRIEELLSIAQRFGL